MVKTFFTNDNWIGYGNIMADKNLRLRPLKKSVTVAGNVDLDLQPNKQARAMRTNLLCFRVDETLDTHLFFTRSNLCLANFLTVELDLVIL
jgi:hypothetical protein